MPHIYIVISCTASRVGKAIRILTRYPYNHVSVAFSEKLEVLHTFARFRRRNTLIGGYTQENIRSLSLGEERPVLVKIYAVPVSEEQFQSVKEYVRSLQEDKDGYFYNLLVAFIFRGSSRTALYKTMTCMDFAVQCLREGGIALDLQHSQSVCELEQILQPWECYGGEINDYPFVDKTTVIGSEYMKKDKLLKEAALTLRHMRMLLNRQRKAKKAEKDQKK